MAEKISAQPLTAALLTMLLLVLAPVASSDTPQERLQGQLADNQKWEQEARSTQATYFQKAEDRLNAQEFTEAIQFYLKVTQVTYPQWDITVYTPPVRYTGRPRQVQLPGTKVVMKQLVTDLNDKAKDKFNSMKKIQLGVLIDGYWNSCEDLLKSGKPGQAYAVFKKISSTDLPESLRKKYEKQTAQRMTDIEKQAGDLLAELKKNLEAHDLDKSKGTLSSFHDKFGEFEECAPIHAVYQKTTKTPEFESMLREDAAAQRFSEAQALLKQEKFADAEDALQELADRYDDTTAGKQAKAKLDEVRADKSLVRAIASQRASKQCEQMLRKAHNYRANGLAGEAQKICRRIIEQFPGTESADKAATLLKEMGITP